MSGAARVIDFVAPVLRENLAGRVYEELRTALFEGHMRPGQRLKIRDLAAAMQVSETPVREAVVHSRGSGRCGWRRRAPSPSRA